MIYYFFSYFAVSMALALMFIPAIRPLAFKLGAVDRGAGRRVHEGVKPRLGGVGIFFAFVIPVSFSLTRGAWNSFDDKMIGVLIGSGIILAVGVYDDIKGARVRTKIFSEILAALIIYAWGIRITILSNPFGAPLNLGWFSLPATVLWIMVITNALNLVDGLDGLATATGILITIIFFLLAGNDPHLRLVYVILAGSLLGFFVYNFPPASIFMGDSGSLFLGFFLASMSVVSSHKATALATIMVPVVAFAFPLMDMFYAVVRRYSRGLPLGKADREHIHHKLLDKGFSKKKALFILFLVNVCGMVALLFMVRRQLNMDFAGLIMITLAALAGVQLLGYADIVPFVRHFRRSIEMNRRGRYYSYVVRRFRRKADSVQTRKELNALLDELLGEYKFSSVDIVLFAHDPENPFYHYAAAGPASGKPLILSYDIVSGGSRIGSVNMTRDLYDDYLLCTSEMARAISEETARFAITEANIDLCEK